MHAVRKALAELTDDLTWFVRATEIRVLCVRVATDMREPALQHVRAVQLHPDCESAVIALYAPCTARDPGWAARIAELRAAYATVIDADTRAGREPPPPLGTLPLTPGVRREHLRAFAGLCSAIANARLMGGRGVILVLSPGSMTEEASSGLRQDLLELIMAPELAAVRWVVLEDHPGRLHTLLEILGDERGMASACLPDAAAITAELSDMANAPPTSGPAGGTWPRGVVPPRRTKAGAPRASVPPPTSESEARSAVRIAMLKAMVAQREGRDVEAIALLREARDRSAAQRMTQESVAAQMLIASTLTKLRRHDQAVEAFEAAHDAAMSAGLLTLAAEAKLGVGTVHMAAGKPPSAAVAAYALAGRIARDARAPILAIEAWRCVGQLCVANGMEKEGTLAWRQALEIASSEAPVAAAQASGAADVAKALADLCRKHRLFAQAASLDAQRSAIERGEIGVRPAGAPAVQTEIAPPRSVYSEVTELADYIAQQVPASTEVLPSQAGTPDAFADDDGDRLRIVQVPMRAVMSSAERDEITEMIEHSSVRIALPPAIADSHLERTAVLPPERRTTQSADDEVTQLASLFARADRTPEGGGS